MDNVIKSEDLEGVGDPLSDPTVWGRTRVEMEMRRYGTISRDTVSHREQEPELFFPPSESCEHKGHTSRSGFPVWPSSCCSEGGEAWESGADK